MWLRALTGTAPDLRPWSALAGQPLAGSATLKASFAGAKGQSVDVTLDGKRLALGDSDSIATLHATARLADLFGP